MSSNTIKLVAFGFVTIFTSALYAQVPAALSVREATKQCEQNIQQHCQNSTCAKFCEESLKNRRRNKDALIAQCKKECTPENRCKIKPLGGNDDFRNRELDAQNREQLIACIAQRRDPTGEKSGRRMEDWKTIETHSWRKLFGR